MYSKSNKAKAVFPESPSLWNTRAGVPGPWHQTLLLVSADSPHNEIESPFSLDVTCITLFAQKLKSFHLLQDQTETPEGGGEHWRPFISLKYSTCFLLFSQQDFSVPAARSSKFHQHGLSLCLFRHRCLWPSSCSKCSPSYLTLFHISPGHPNRHYFLPHCI